MKFTKDNVEAIGIVLIAGVAAYAAYRAFKVGEDAASAVSNTIGKVGDIFKSGYQEVKDTASKVTDALHITTAADMSINSATEIRKYENDIEAKADASAGAVSMASNLSTGNFIAAAPVATPVNTGTGMDSVTESYPQGYSPDAGGSTGIIEIMSAEDQALIQQDMGLASMEMGP